MSGPVRRPPPDLVGERGLGRPAELGFEQAIGGVARERADLDDERVGQRAQAEHRRGSRAEAAPKPVPTAAITARSGSRSRRSITPTETGSHHSRSSTQSTGLALDPSPRGEERGAQQHAGIRAGLGQVREAAAGNARQPRRAPGPGCSEPFGDHVERRRLADSRGAGL